MRGRRGLQAARRCGGRWLASLLVAVIAIDAPLRAFAQAASPPGQPAAAQPAAAQSGTSAKLANVPDSIPYDHNPASSPTRSMAIDIKNAILEAGIDLQASAKHDDLPTSDTVTFEDTFPDGDMIVTGKLVDGRIVLTKQFKPLLPSGDGVGAAVTIPYNPTAAAGATTSTAGASTPDPNSKSAALNTAVEAELRSAYEALLKQARALQGERIVSGINIAEGTVFFTLLTRNVYAFQLSVHMERLEKYANQPRAERLAHIQRLQALAKRIQYWWAIRAYLRNALSGSQPINQMHRELRNLAQEAGVDTERGRTLLNMADRPEAWLDLSSAEINKLIDEDPVVAASEPFLRRLWSDERPEDLLEMYDDVVADTAVDAQAEQERVRAINTVEGIAEFLKPQYARTRAAAAVALGRFSQNQLEPAEGFARALQEAQGLEYDPLGLNTPLIIGGLILLTLVVPANMPILMAVVGAADLAAGGYAIYHDGRYLLNLRASAENARRGRIVLGPDAFSQMSDEQQLVALSIFLSALGVATGGRALTKAVAEARAAEILRRTRAAFPVDASVATNPGVQRGARQAADLGVPQKEIDSYLKLSRQNPHPFGQILYGIGKLDEDMAEAIAAGVPRAEVDAMFKAARATRSLWALGNDFPLNLSRAAVNRKNFTFVIDRKYAGTFRDAGDFPTEVDDVPLEHFRNFWNGTEPARVVRADVRGLFDLRQKLTNMAMGNRDTLSKAERAALDETLRRDDLRSLYFLIQDEGRAVRLFDDDVIDVGRRLLKHPNRDAIADGLEILPAGPAGPASAGANLAAPPAGIGVNRWLLTGTAPTAAVEAVRRQRSESSKAGPESFPLAAGAGGVARAASGSGSESIPAGPPMAIDGAAKPKKPRPMTLILTPDIAVNPVAVNNAIRIFLVQYAAAEGQDVTAPGASQPPKDPDSDAAGGSGPEDGPGNQPQPLPIKIMLTSLGRSSGDAFEMTVFNEGPEPVTLSAGPLVLEPIEVARAGVEQELAAMRGAGRATATLKAYCLEFLKQPPTVGMLFRLAPASVQQRFAQLAGRIFDASKRLRDAGRLRPPPGDPGDPASYFDDIRQWAIWTQEQGFDETGYTRAFSQHARKNVEAAGHKWTRELEKAFAGLASGRWQAVQLVLGEAR